jgi:MYXO-CTERM domain-containing protein
MVFGLAVLQAAVLMAAPSASFAEDAGAPFGDLPLVDEVVVGSNEDAHEFTESAGGVTEVQDILGTPTRVIPNEGGPRYFAYKIGKDAGLEAGKAYVLAVEFPEDAPRTVYVINRGAEMNRGFSTGKALGDVAQTYAAQNLESIDYPLSGESRWWRTFFHLHDRFAEITAQRGSDQRPGVPADGFWVIIAQPGQWKDSNDKQAPVSEGAAVSRIRLFEVPDPESYYTSINYPGDLPRRHIFWREEMSDNVVRISDANVVGVESPTDWFRYKAELMRFLGINTFGKDLLEFGHNQGWDSDYKDYGGNQWYWNNSDPQRWTNIIDMLADYDHYVLPYYEYTGSRGQNGLGDERRCRPLTKDGAYTHIDWSENACVDVSDPDFLDDAKALLDTTILQHADRANFLGAWIRTRVSHIPMSFTDETLARFAEAQGLASVTRSDLQGDDALLQDYYVWWYGQRQAFLAELRDYLQAESGDAMKIFYTAYTAEGGPAFSPSIVTDDASLWSGLGYENPVSHDTVYDDDLYAERIIDFEGTWGQWEWQHSVPPPDPQNYAGVDDILFTHPFNRLYTVSDPDTFDLMRTPGGLAMVYHYSLNENVMTTSGGDQLVGYFVTDVERAGPYVTLPEARALAYGDPRYIGYLSGHSFNRGFPSYVRNFNLAFLALPAVPSQVDEGAADDANVVVRSYATQSDNQSDTQYYAVINVGLEDVAGVSVTLPDGQVLDAVTDEEISRSGAVVTFDLYPGQVRALQISTQDGSTNPGGDAGDSADGGDQADAGGSSNDTGGSSNDTADGSGPDDKESSNATSEEGCSCASTRGSSPEPAWLMVVLVGLGVLVRGRRRLYKRGPVDLDG